MPDGAVHIARLAPLDAGRYNAFFAAGADAHPETLRITRADIVAAPFSTEASAEAVTFVALLEGGAWAGVGSVERERGRAKRRHIAWVVRMYVPSEHAGRGIGRRLLHAAIEEARRMVGISKVNLTVAADNAAAIGLYESVGFRTFGREEDAFRASRPLAELSMTLAL